jgi:hypothetical protein
MKKILILITLSLTIIGGTACKKCKHCVEKDPSGNVVYDYKEVCSKHKSELETYEKDVNALVDPGNTIECSD